MPECRRATISFQSWGGFVELRHFDKHFVKKARKRGPRGKHLGVFFQDNLKTTF